jgi:hypothetical protein
MPSIVKRPIRVRVLGVFGDVSKVVVQYGVNMIPTAYITMAPGRPGNDRGGPLARIPEYGKRVRVYVEMDTNGRDSVMRKVFDGTMTGVSTAHTSGSTGLTLVCPHFANALASAPALTSFSPAAAYDFETAIGFSEYRNVTHFEFKLARLLADGDLWAVISVLLRLFTTFPFVDTSDAEAVLGRLRGHLILKPKVDVRTLSRTLIATMMSVYNGGTMWHALLAVANMFKFVVVPTANHVFLIPSVRGLQGTSDYLGKDNIVVGNPTVEATPNVKAIVARGGPEFPFSTYGAYSITRPIIVSQTLAPVGQVEVVRIPAWLIPMRIQNARDVSLEVLGRAFTNVVSQTAGIPEDISDALSDWARTMVYDKIFQGNSANVTTPVSTRIIPGTNLRMRLPGIISQDSSTLFTGFLQSVTLTYDAVGHTTSRTMFLTHVRDDLSDNSLVTEEHPLLDGLNPGLLSISGTYF